MLDPIKEAQFLLLEDCLSGGTNYPEHCTYCRVAHELDVEVLKIKAKLRVALERLEKLENP